MRYDILRHDILRRAAYYHTITRQRMRLLRLLFSLMIGFAASLILALTFFGYSTFTSPIDRLFLVLVPALAIGLTLHHAFFSQFSQSPQFPQFSIPHYLLAFFLTLNLTYGAAGYFQEPLRTPYNMVLFTAFFVTSGSVAGYYLVRRAAQSFRSGFLSKSLNVLLALSLPAFLIAIILASLQFPSMFVMDYIRVPRAWMPLFILTAFASAVWSPFLIAHQREASQWDASRITRLVHPTSFLLHLSQNLPGLYAAGMFFLIHLILARSLNHPALNYNSVLFEADAGPWMEILASPQGGSVGRAVHPLSLIIVRPLIRLAAGFMGEHYALGGMLVVSAAAGLCVFMTWLFVRRATESQTYALLFAILLGSTSTHLLFGSLTENYIFGAASLIFFFLLIQANEQRFSVLVPAGLLLFGVTITNIAQGIIALFFNKFGFRRLAQYSILILALGVLLTAFTAVLHPGKQTLFFVPNDIAFEFNFIKSSDGATSDPMRLSEPASISRKLQVVSRSVLLYGVVGPKPLAVVSEKPPFPTIDMKTFDLRTGKLASYKGLANLPLALWLTLLGGGLLMFVKNYRASKHTPLMLGLLGALGFNFLMHLFYGTELFLYTPYWVYALILFTALALSNFAGQRWFEVALALIVLVLMTNNLGFIVEIQRALAPFYAAAPVQ